MSLNNTINKVEVLCMQGLPREFASVENLPANTEDARDVGSIPGSGTSLEEGNGIPLQCSCLENSTDRGAWWSATSGVAESWT